MKQHPQSYSLVVGWSWNRSQAPEPLSLWNTLRTGQDWSLCLPLLHVWLSQRTLMFYVNMPEWANPTPAFPEGTKQVQVKHCATQCPCSDCPTAPLCSYTFAISDYCPRDSEPPPNQRNNRKTLSSFAADLAPVPPSLHSGSENPQGPRPGTGHRNRTIFSPGQAEALEKGAEWGVRWDRRSLVCPGAVVLKQRLRGIGCG